MTMPCARCHALDAMAPKRTRPDTRSGRAALTDAGVDGGARADRNYQAGGKSPSNQDAPRRCENRCLVGAPANLWRPMAVSSLVAPRFGRVQSGSEKKVTACEG